MGTEGIKRIALYGRNGVGKTTISANLGMALARAGYRVLLVGCGCQADPGTSSQGDDAVPALLELMRKRPAALPDEAVREGGAGVFRLETGTPLPGGADPGGSILSAVQRINVSGLFERLDLDHVIYTVQGDEAGGGFTVPLRAGLFTDIFTVMSAELKSVRAANSLFERIRQHSGEGGMRAGGIIANFMDASYSRALVDEFAGITATSVLAYLPRSHRLENSDTTVFGSSPDPLLQEEFHRLALKVVARCDSLVPHPMAPDEIWRFSMKWNTRFQEMETAEGAGAGI